MKRVKFKVTTKKGQKVYRIEINIRSKDSKDRITSSYQDGIHVTELKIVHQTPYKLVLNDPFVTILDRLKEGERKESYKHVLDDISVIIRTKESFWPNGIFASIYSTREPEKCIKQIKHEMILKINKEYGFLRSSDLEQQIYDMQFVQLTKKQYI